MKTKVLFISLNFARLKEFSVFTLLLLLMASCDGDSSDGVVPDISEIPGAANIPGVEIFEQGQNKNVAISNLKFTDRYQTMNVKLDVKNGITSNNRLDDAKKIKVKAFDKYTYAMPLMEPNQPKVTSIKYVAPEQLAWAGFHCLILVDLCQPSGVIQKEHDYVKSMQRIFCHQNLYVAFMLPHGKVTNVIAATNYVIDSYVNINASILGNSVDNFSLTSNDSLPSTMQHAYLYRSVAHILSDAIGHSGTTFDNAKHKVVLVFSDGQVYNDDNMPVDPEHFVMQERLISISKRLDGNVRMYYNSLTQNTDVSLTDNNIMRMLCKTSGGRYLEDFSWNNMQNYISEDFRYPLTDYEVQLRYKKGNILMGNARRLIISFYDRKGNKLVAQCYKDYNAGSLYEPIVVGDASELRVYVFGASISFLLFGVIYIILQLVLPYILNYRFEKKYVHKYGGPNMSVEGNLVADTCYYCKAPFQVGDTIVAKCKHTMHLDCWNENGQHCPEHGKHCPEGSHFYDKIHLFDPANGSFFIKWLIVASIGALLAWLYATGFSHEAIYDLLEDTVSALLTSDENPTVVLDDYRQYASSSLYLMQVFTTSLSFMLTVALAFAASYHRVWYKRMAEILCRAVGVAVVTYCVFYALFCGLISCGFSDDFILIDIVPWTIMTYVIAYGSTRLSRVQLDLRKFFLYGLLIGILGAIEWNIIGMEETIFQLSSTVLLLMLYATAVAFIVAKPLPNHDHSFLHVQGEIKEMDIALYKWLKQSDNAVVTIGCSVDCSLQLAWDTKSVLAPIQAEIRQHRGAVLLTCVEGAVVIRKKSLSEGKWVHLYHGDTFIIGTTTFTYLEM